MTCRRTKKENKNEFIPLLEYTSSTMDLIKEQSLELFFFSE